MKQSLSNKESRPAAAFHYGCSFHTRRVPRAPAIGKGGSPVRKEFQVITALCGELFDWYLHILVVILLVQVFPANHPAVGVLGINAVCRSDMVGEIATCVPMYPVRHARRDLQAFHARQVSLCMFLVEMQAQRKEHHYKEATSASMAKAPRATS